MKDYQKPLPKSALGLRNWGKYEKPMPFNIYVNVLNKDDGKAVLDVLGEIVFAENGNVCKLKAENELNITIVSDEKTAASRDVEKNITKRKNENVNI